MNFKLSKKRQDTGKYWTYGSFKKNQWGNYQASFKVTPELLKLFKEHEDSYINFSAFEDEKKEESPKQPVYDDLSDDVPF